MSDEVLSESAGRDRICSLRSQGEKQGEERKGQLCRGLETTHPQNELNSDRAAPKASCGGGNNHPDTV